MRLPNTGWWGNQLLNRNGQQQNIFHTTYHASVWSDTIWNNSTLLWCHAKCWYSRVFEMLRWAPCCNAGRKCLWAHYPHSLSTPLCSKFHSQQVSSFPSSLSFLHRCQTCHLSLPIFPTAKSAMNWNSSCPPPYPGFGAYVIGMVTFFLS